MQHLKKMENKENDDCKYRTDVKQRKMTVNIVQMEHKEK